MMFLRKQETKKDVELFECLLLELSFSFLPEIFEYILQELRN